MKMQGLAVLALCCALSVQAEQLTLPVSQQGSYSGPLPARGIEQQQVQERFGDPIAWQDAVGEPPISRWEYPDFFVYFEKDRVLHCVIKPNAEQHPSTQE